MSEESDRLDDDALLARLADGNLWLRSFLCTLARRGARLRGAQPDRAARLVAELEPWPIYKGGQFLFDLMEWEDFMIDGPPPPVLTSALGMDAWRRLSRSLVSARGLLDGAAVAAVTDALEEARALGVRLTISDEGLPPLDPGMYLYRDVVLGVLASAAPLIRLQREAGGTSEVGLG